MKKCDIELLDALSYLIDRMDEAEVKLIARSYVKDALRGHK